MTVELKVPEFGESVQEVHVARWLRREGDRVERDEDLVELETDKATMELAAPAAGIVTKIAKPAGSTAQIGDVLASIEAVGDESTPTAVAREQIPPTVRRKIVDSASVPQMVQTEVPAVDRSEVSKVEEARTESTRDEFIAETPQVHATPAARKELQRHGLTAQEVGQPGQRLRRPDVQKFVERQHQEPPGESEGSSDPTDEVRVEPMSLVRRRIGERLVAAQHQAALLTTFNEIDMSAIMELRRQYAEKFQQQHGVKLGYMSFFVKATVAALRLFPQLNAFVDGTNLVYHTHVHMGVAISTPRGLVVPVLRRSETLSFAQIEQQIADFVRRAEAGKLVPDELSGGTFTISNGGVFGSLFSTPIVNPPQSGVLGMHAIQERPITKNRQIISRPMMYVALTYDHRVVDGRESVTCLRRIKELLEEPSQLLLGT